MQLRFRTVDALGSAADRKGLVEEAANVGWLLGVSFTIQVVPGPGGRVGTSGRRGGCGPPPQPGVVRGGLAVYRAAAASLVVATIEGGTAQQTWHNAGRALDCAERLVEEGARSSLCSDLADEPGPAVRCLASAATRGEALRQIRRQRAADLLPAPPIGPGLGPVPCLPAQPARSGVVGRPPDLALAGFRGACPPGPSPCHLHAVGQCPLGCGQRRAERVDVGWSSSEH